MAPGVVEEKVTAILTKIQDEDVTRALIDAGVIIAAAALLARCSTHSPKATVTSLVVVCSFWVTWLACKMLLVGPEASMNAVEDVMDRMEAARRATEMAVLAVATMLLSWIVLALPMLQDLAHAVQPLCVELWHEVSAWWTALTPQGKAILVICTAAICSSSAAAVALCRHQDTVKEVLFQLSFLVIGPLLWWVTNHLELEVTLILVEMMLSGLPVLVSCRLLWLLKLCKKNAADSADSSAAMAANAQSWSWQLHIPDADFHIPVELLARMCLWLSYWSCWPYLIGAFLLIQPPSRLPEAAGRAAASLLLVIIVWTQFWGVSQVMPWLLAHAASSLQSTAEHLGVAATDATQRVAVASSSHWLPWTAWLQISAWSKTQWVIAAAACAIILIVGTLFMQVLAVASTLVTVVILLAVSFESAQCVARRSEDLVPARLAFWPLVVIWLMFTRLPLLGPMVAMWSPAVLLVVLLLAEGMVAFVLDLCANVILPGCLDFLSCGARSKTKWQRLNQHPDRAEFVDEAPESMDIALTRSSE